MSLLLQEILKQAEQLSPEDRQALIQQLSQSATSNHTNQPISSTDSPLGAKLRAIRAQIVESGIPLLNDAELEQEIASRRGDREFTCS